MAVTKNSKVEQKKAVEEIVETAKAVETAKTEKKKAPTKRTTAKKTVENVYVQCHGKQISISMLSEFAEKAKKLSGVKSPKTVDVYVKPEDNAVYYVVDGETGQFEL